MQTETIVYICIAGLAALLLALFQYVYKSKLNKKLTYGLAALRTITFFAIGLLLINPKFETITYVNQKPTLVLAVDNSESITYLEQNENTIKVLDQIRSNKKLSERFNLQVFTFGKTLNRSEVLQFEDGQSNIAKSLKQLFEIYNNEQAPIVLITDGNQTYGEDYSYAARQSDQPIYPIILGDSVNYLDLSLKLVNVNRYAFLKNRFPIEIIANYNGDKAASTELNIWKGDNIVFNKSLRFGPTKTSEIIRTTLLASSVGVQTYKVELSPVENEKNKINNVKNFAVEIIDQKTNVAIVAERIHPDIGTLKKSIESNEQRTATIMSPNEYLNKLNDFQLVVVYQPNYNFTAVIDKIVQQKLNSFIITGTTTDFDFLNNTGLNLFGTITNQTENFQALLNKNYNNFIIEDLDFEEFPPLKSEFGSLEILAPYDVILYKTVNGINTGEVLLATYTYDNTKHLLLNGEGIWRWRAQSYLLNENFENFDVFTNKLIQYLSTNKKRNRLNIDHKSFYDGNDEIIISAQYFNENFEFDSNAALTLNLKTNEGVSIKEVPLLLNNGAYSADLNGIDAGTYQFSIRHDSEPVSATGKFEVLDYNVEQQFLNADREKLKALADKSLGAAYYSSQGKELINNLLADERYKTVQKSTKNIVPLIDWYLLLGIIAMTLFIEWFTRKYNGLI